VTNLFLDLHLIQTVPPSCINRDDTGAPKKAVYGGVQRHRVSSQAWKYVARRYLHEVASVETATRSRRHPVALVRLAQEADPTVDAAAAAIAAVEVVGSLTSAKSGTLKVKDTDLAVALEQVETEEAVEEAEGDREAKAVVVSLSGAERRALAAVVAEVAKKITAGGKVDRAKDINAPAKAALVGAAQAADQHLFGRFIAGVPEAKVEAAVHVAHALSTHAAYSEDDAYTAIGDLEPGDSIQRGADFLDVAEFVSSTLYRYVRLDLGDLLEQYGPEEVAELTGQVAEAFALSMPGGKGSGFAPDSVPAVVTAVLRSDRPVSAAQAFEAPVRSTEGYESASVQRLASFLANVDASGMVAAPLAVATASIAHDPIGDRLTGRLSASVAGLVRPALGA